MVTFATTVLACLFAFRVAESIAVLIMFYPYTLILTAPATVVTSVNGLAGCKVLMGSKRTVRRLTRISRLMFSGAKALAGKAPGIIGVVSRGPHRVVRLMTSLRSGSRRPLTGTVIGRCGGGSLCRISKFGVRVNGKVAKGVGRAGVVTKGGALLRSRGVRVPLSGAAGGKRVRVFITGRGRLVKGVLLTSAVHRGAGRAVASLGGLEVGAALLAKSGRGANACVTGRTGIQGIGAGYVPRSGAGCVGSRRAEGREITVVKSKVGSTPSLGGTGMKVTVKGVKDSVSVRTTSVALVGSGVRFVPRLVRVSEGAVEAVDLDVKFTLSLGVVTVVLTVLKVLGPVRKTLVRGVKSILIVTLSSVLIGCGDPELGCGAGGVGVGGDLCDAVFRLWFVGGGIVCCN